MKCEIVIDKNCEEKVVVFAHEKTPLVCEIENLVLEKVLTGYNDTEIVKLELSKVFAFFCESNKVFALLEDKRFELKMRLYQIEEFAGKSFLKVNQSCIVNVGKIEKFEASLYGGLSVVLKNGHRDFVSRRQLKAVKERIEMNL